MILLIDNFDSFAHNLARYLRLLSGEVVVVRNNELNASDARLSNCRALVISPGPCSPTEAGNTLSILDAMINRIPVLGVCLGHQAIVQSLGGRIVRAAEPVHGRTSQIFHDGKAEFAGLPLPFMAARYHSLVADRKSLPKCLEVSARLQDDTIMGVRHRELPVFGWQFHPESILTPSGLDMLRSFLAVAGIDLCGDREFRAELSWTESDRDSSEPVMPLPWIPGDSSRSGGP